MEFTKKEMKEFKRIYRQDFGQDISNDRALEMARRVITLFKVICRPLPSGKEAKNEKQTNKN